MTNEVKTGTELVPRQMNVETVEKWGKIVKEGDLIPKDMTLQQAMVVVQSGNEMGLQPLQSIRCMSIIRGRVCMKVELQLALARTKGVKVKKIEGTAVAAIAILTRKEEEVTCTYTIQEAKTANLVAAGGNWIKYPKQMLRWRAIGDALKIIAPDFTMGLLSPDEAENIEPAAATSAEPKGKPEVTQPESKTESKEDKPITEDQANVLTKILNKKKTDYLTVQEALELPPIESLTINQFHQAIEFLNKR